MKFHDTQAAGYFCFKWQRIFYEWEFLFLRVVGGDVQKRCKEKFHISALPVLAVYVNEPNFLGFLLKMDLFHQILNLLGFFQTTLRGNDSEEQFECREGQVGQRTGNDKLQIPEQWSSALYIIRNVKVGRKRHFVFNQEHSEQCSLGKLKVIFFFLEKLGDRQECWLLYHSVFSTVE